MIFREQTYSVLLVSASEKFSESMKALLPSSEFWPINSVSTAGEVRRSMLGGAYDMVIINTPLQEEFGMELAADLCAGSNAQVLLFVRSEMADEVFRRVVDSGVMVIARPTSTQTVLHTLKLMCSAREHMRLMERKQSTVEDKIKEIRLINKAKWRLIEHLNISETEAHRYIEKQAMDQRITEAQVAENILCSRF